MIKEERQREKIYILKLKINIENQCASQQGVSKKTPSIYYARKCLIILIGASERDFGFCFK